MAAGPKTIALDFVERLSRIREDVESMLFALGHARGCDLFEWERWRTLYHALKQAQDQAEVALAAAKEEAEQARGGTYEEVVAYLESLEYAVEEQVRKGSALRGTDPKKAACAGGDWDMRVGEPWGAIEP